MLHPRINQRWARGFCVVIASGPSLTQADADLARPYDTIVVNDSWKLAPWADVLYGCDTKWWNLNKGARGFKGERWSSHSAKEDGHDNRKTGCAEKWGLELVAGGMDRGFSMHPSHINYGQNSGFQAINLAILFGAVDIALLGFNMQPVDGVAHFFGSHPKPLEDGPYPRYCKDFEWAADLLPDSIRVYNCTARSALTCFEQRTPNDLADLARHRLAHRYAHPAQSGERSAKD